MIRCLDPVVDARSSRPTNRYCGWVPSRLFSGHPHHTSQLRVKCGMIETVCVITALIGACIWACNARRGSAWSSSMQTLSMIAGRVSNGYHVESLRSSDREEHDRADTRRLSGS